MVCVLSVKYYNLGNESDLTSFFGEAQASQEHNDHRLDQEIENIVRRSMEADRDNEKKTFVATIRKDDDIFRIAKDLCSKLISSGVNVAMPSSMDSKIQDLSQAASTNSVVVE